MHLSGREELGRAVHDAGRAGRPGGRALAWEAHIVGGVCRKPAIHRTLCHPIRTMKNALRTVEGRLPALACALTHSEIWVRVILLMGNPPNVASMLCPACFVLRERGSKASR